MRLNCKEESSRANPGTGSVPPASTSTLGRGASAGSASGGGRTFLVVACGWSQGMCQRAGSAPTGLATSAASSTSRRARSAASATAPVLRWPLAAATWCWAEAATSELGGTKTGGATATSIAGRLGVRPRGSAAAARTSSRGTGSAWSADSRTSPLARSVASASVRVLPGQGDAPRRSNRAWWGTGTVLSADSTTSPPATTAESAPNQGPQEPARLKKVGTGAALNVGLSILDLATSAVTAC
mmetsp:Transcript_764/g.1618  ORF Transcript_764/g.1618 Transcript_764/m.1618 type:complete len:242 (+) Transcript_764:851-1576(+)